MNGHKRPILTGLILTVALLTAGGTRLGACSCGAGGAACQVVWNSEAVFVARAIGLGEEIESVRMIGALGVGWRERVVRLKVSEAFRGVEVGDLTVRTAASSASCGFTFEVGRTYLVFADRDKVSGAFTVSLCSNTALVDDSAEALAYLRGPFGVPSDLGVVRGTVAHYDQYDSVDHPAPSTPFAGAELRLEGYSQAHTTNSGPDGAYKFAVPAGDYRLFVRVRDGVYAWPGADGYPVTLKDNRGCAVAHVTVRPDSRVFGRLLDEAGRPVPFMPLGLVREAKMATEPLWDMRDVLTDERGRFEFMHFDPGRYVIGVAQPYVTHDARDRVLWISRVGDGKPATVKVAAEQRLDVGDVRLPSGVATVALSGVVVDSGGKPVQGAHVRFRASNPDHFVMAAPTLSDNDGRFSLSVVAGRTYRISAEWHSTIPGATTYLSGESDPFEAVGEIKPLRLVLTAAR
jgi:Carboxypeptidase regulatory-like domain